MSTGSLLFISVLLHIKAPFRMKEIGMWELFRLPNSDGNTKIRVYIR